MHCSRQHSPANLPAWPWWRWRGRGGTPATALSLLIVFANAAVCLADNDAAGFFQRACAPCHSADARGDGPLAAELANPAPDLTRIAQRAGGQFSRQKVYATIEGLGMPDAHGTREMPVWGDVILAEELGSSTSTFDAKKAEISTRQRLRALVGYLESIQQ